MFLLKQCTTAGLCLILNSISQFQPPTQTSLPLRTGGCDSAAIGQCIDELLAAKRNGNKTERYVKSLGHYLRQFSAGRAEKPIAEFSFAEIEDWMSRYPCADTRRTWLSRLSPLFSFAVRRGYIEKNPCDRVERVTVDRQPPVILTPAQSRLLLATVPTMLRPYLALGMFAGIRPEEITRLDWSQINFETKTARVDGKTRRWRIVPLPDVAVRLLEKHPVKSGPVAPSHSTVTRWKHRARAALGLPRWPQDLLRHTAASYLVALHQDAAKVALWLGNSPRILMSHYHEPVSAEACAEFWNLDGITK